MVDQRTANEEIMKLKVLESSAAVEYDRHCLQQDEGTLREKAKYLKQFRDGNKYVIMICV